jgi:hypothetical protein
MRPDTITLGIEEKYTPEKFADIASRMAAAIAEVEAITGEKKVSDAAFNERIKKAENTTLTLARQYNKGCEVAQIGCDIRYDCPEPGKKSYIRMDNGETVEVHDMNWEEKQETIQFPLAASPDTPTLAQPTDDQVSEALGKLEEARVRCPRCKAAKISTVDNLYLCFNCSFQTANEDELLIDLPNQPPSQDPPPDQPNEPAA